MSKRSDYTRNTNKLTKLRHLIAFQSIATRKNGHPGQLAVCILLIIDTLNKHGKVARSTQIFALITGSCRYGRMQYAIAQLRKHKLIEHSSPNGYKPTPAGIELIRRTWEEISSAQDQQHDLFSATFGTR